MARVETSLHEVTSLRIETTYFQASGGFCCVNVVAVGADGTDLCMFKAFGPKSGIPIVSAGEALEIVLVQFGEYKDGDGAAKFHAVNIAADALALYHV